MGGGIAIYIFFGLLILAVAALIVLIILSRNPEGPNVNRGQGAVSDAPRTLVAAQREAERSGKPLTEAQKANLAVAAAAEGDPHTGVENPDTQVTLAKKLRYAKLPITPAQFRMIQVGVSIPIVVGFMQFGTLPLLLVGLVLGPVFTNSWLNSRVHKRFKAFDVDYPTLLLSFTSLLKTGMNALTGLEAAANGLPKESLVRAEVNLLIERLRLGLTEEQAINAFGEDIAHPELELFVQSLLLSKRVGGTLSSTLERLARQVRKRQQFRDQAVAAVGMERNSMYAVAFIMGGLLLYLIWVQPDLILPALSHPRGRGIFHWGIFSVIMGYLWSRVVTNIKV